MPFGCRKAITSTRRAIGEVNQTKAQLGLRIEPQAHERLEIAVVCAISRHRHVDQLNAALDLSAKAVRELYHVAHIDRLNDMPVVGVAVTEVKKKLDVRRHVIRKARENCRE